MEKIDLRTFHKRVDAVRLGQVVYMPHAPTESDFCGAYDVLMQRLDRLPGEMAERIIDYKFPFYARAVVCDAARDAAWPAADKPDWFGCLPDAFRREAEREWATHVIEDPNILLGFEFAGLGGYAVDLDMAGMLGAAYHDFDLGRLQRIRQLAWLTTPVLPQDRPGVIPFRFEHNRLNHVWDVAAIANLLAFGLELSDSDTATLVLAAATHDARTPAGGDTTKLLDRDYFDEDKHYPELLDKFDSAKLLGEYGIVREKLVRTVLGQDLLGRLLDLADKTGYLARDAFWFHFRFRSDVHDDEEGNAIHDVLRRRPDACAAWHHAAVVDGKLVFTDAESLALMLKLRALLFRALYFHPAARFTEFIVSHLILRHLYDCGQISRRDLLAWGDDELDRMVERYGTLGFGDNYGEPLHEGFTDQAAAEMRRQELIDQGEICVMLETLPERIKSGTDFLVMTNDGPRTLRDAVPDLSAPVDALAMTVNRYRLYWVPRETIPDGIMKLLLSRK